MIYSDICLYQYELRHSPAISVYNPILLHFLICCSNCSSFGCLDLFQFCPSLSNIHIPHHCGFCFILNTLLLLGTIRCSKFILGLSCLNPRISHFSKELGHFPSNLKVVFSGPVDFKYAKIECCLIFFITWAWRPYVCSSSTYIAYLFVKQKNMLLPCIKNIEASREITCKYFLTFLKKLGIKRLLRFLY